MKRKKEKRKERERTENRTWFRFLVRQFDKERVEESEVLSKSFEG